MWRHIGKQLAQNGETPEMGNTVGKFWRNQRSRNDHSSVSNCAAYANQLSELKVWSALQL